MRFFKKILAYKLIDSQLEIKHPLAKIATFILMYKMYFSI